MTNERVLEPEASPLIGRGPDGLVRRKAAEPRLGKKSNNQVSRRGDALALRYGKPAANPLRRAFNRSCSKWGSPDSLFEKNQCPIKLSK
jgi:hypothetical protein